ncbi:MAG: argininosuccinate lyase [Alphaproteobacteria bacterium GM202ARS2]|nr:argininosuccinate lyase [Alphaproteobacteria bacterium GM202ARS2]
MSKKTSQESGGAKHPVRGGRFARGLAPLMERMNASIHVDKRLAEQDIRASFAHVAMLVATGIISKACGANIERGLKRVAQEIADNTLAYDEALEDIHMHIEARLHHHIGDDALSLHTARSRNDQVATDFRLWCRDAYDQIDKAMARLQACLCRHAETHAETLMPGYTHLQNAQVITLGHHFMAYVFMVGRDRSRVADARRRLNECPLGACALAGTSFAIDRAMTAQALGFAKPMDNAMDAVSDRDFVVDFLSTAALAGVHLSRLAEDMILWSNPSFGFIRLDERWSTGSSIMPQKRNPDAAELVRAESGALAGHLIDGLMVLKALPLAYSKDMQRDKQPTFSAYDSWMQGTQALTGMLDTLHVEQEAMGRAARLGYTNATDAADWLVHNKKMPFRKAHHVVGALVAHAEKEGVTLDELPLATMQALCPDIDEGILAVLAPEKAVRARNSLGGTSPEQVRLAVKRARQMFNLEEQG